MRDQSVLNGKFYSLPCYITVGVTGHRRLENEEAIRQAVRDVLLQIRKKFCNPKESSFAFCILSPLAEGADRIVAEEGLNFDKNAVLKVVLPLPREEYTDDFQTKKSKAQFNSLLDKAKAVMLLPDKRLDKNHKKLMLRRSRNQAYEEVGHFVVDHCDILLAIWDGKPSRGKGGTASVVHYAKKRQRPIYIINSNNPGSLMAQV